PFHSFRKHQKVMFAGLAIICMFIFVLTGSAMSGWDYFVGLMENFGLSTSRNPTVATIYGSNVNKSEILNVQRQRQVANQFMAQASATAYRKVGESRQQAMQTF